MYKEKSTNFDQLGFYSPFTGLSPEKAQRLKDSWAGTFYKEVYLKIDETPFAQLYSTKGSRPNIPIRLLVSALILKEFQGLTDEELLENIEWNRQFQVALGLSNQDKVPFSARTLTRFRTKIYQFEKENNIDLIHQVIKSLLDNLNEEMGTQKNLRHMDSFMVSSNTRKLNRLEIFYETIRKCLKALKASEVIIPEELEHYLYPYDRNQVFYYDHSVSYEDRVRLIIRDVLTTMGLFTISSAKLKEEDLLKRLIDEQLVVENGQYRLKKGKSEGLNSKTMQTPHDPDATYREKKGKHIGYVGNIQEAACEDGSMITDYQYEQNNYSDSQFLKDFIQKESKISSGSKTTLVTDGAYASTENEQIAKANGIEHVSTELAGRKTEDICADFVFNDEGTRILRCPNGLSPLRCSYISTSGQCRAVFDLSSCPGCPYFNICHPKLQKKTAVKILSVKSALRARSRRRQTGETFNRQRNFRNGAEAIPSIMRNKFNVDRMPVRGLIRTRHLFGFKIAGLAITKFLRFKKKKSIREAQCA